MLFFNIYFLAIPQKSVKRVIFALTMLPAVGGVTEAADGYTNNSGVGASGMTPHYVKWTLYQDRTLYLYPDNTSTTRYLESGDDNWAGQIWFPDAGAMVKMNGKDIVEHLVVASGVDNIYNSMFSGYPNLKTVTLAGMTRIEASAFSSCPQLTSVTVNGSLRAIGAYAFADCAALETFTATGIVETIAERAFCNNDGSSLSNDVSLTAFHALSIGQVGNSAFKIARRFFPFLPSAEAWRIMPFGAQISRTQSQIRSCSFLAIPERSA